jgi:hypothetical protein
MAALYKKEIIIRPSSSVGVQAAIAWTNNWLGGFYNAEDNADKSKTFFADIFDPRGDHVLLLRVYHSSCTKLFGMKQLTFVLIGDKNDPGLEDGYIDESEEVPENESFILADAEEYKALKKEVDNNSMLIELTEELEARIKRLEDLLQDTTVEAVGGGDELVTDTVTIGQEEAIDPMDP